jgi:hypothetical protein
LYIIKHLALKAYGGVAVYLHQYSPLHRMDVSGSLDVPTFFPQYPSYRRPGGFQSRSEEKMEKIKTLPLSGIEPGHPTVFRCT